MKVAIIGTHSVGKTTLIEALKKEKKFENFLFLPETTIAVRKSGFDVKEKTDNLTQLRIMQEDISRACWLRNTINTDVITDRCILDTYMYTWYFHHEKKQVDAWVLEFNRNLTNEFIEDYDLLIYIESEIDLVLDGVRSESNEFRDKIATLFDERIKHIKVPVYEVTGTVKERVDMVKQIFKVHKHNYERK